MTTVVCDLRPEMLKLMMRPKDEDGDREQEYDVDDDQ